MASPCPVGVVHDRLAAIRYPDEHASYASADWDRWVQEARAEAVRLVGDDARWRASRVMVDDDVYEGVQAAVEPRFTAAALYLPEGRDFLSPSDCVQDDGGCPTGVGSGP